MVWWGVLTSMPTHGPHTAPPSKAVRTRKGRCCSETRAGKGRSPERVLLGHRRDSWHRFSIVSANPAVEAKEGFPEEGSICLATRWMVTITT